MSAATASVAAAAASAMTTSSTLANNSTANATTVNDVHPHHFALEILAWAVVYALVILRGLVPRLRSYLSSQPFWLEMEKRPGQVLSHMGEEAVLALALAAHHIAGGVLMLAGHVRNDPQLWLHGLTIEIGFEIVDVLCLLTNAWPYPIVQPGLKFLTLCHHIPGMLCSPPLIFYAQAHANPALQAIGWALLLAGGVSLLTDGVKQTRSLDTQLGQWLVLHSINLVGVIVARWWIFPKAGLELLDTMRHSDALFNATVVGIGSMAIFNLIVVAILSEKLVRYGWVWLRHGSLAKSVKTVKVA